MTEEEIRGDERAKCIATIRRMRGETANRDAQGFASAIIDRLKCELMSETIKKTANS